MDVKKPRVLLWDLETAYVTALVFSLFRPMIPHSNIVKDWFIICGGWKWLDEEEAACVASIPPWDDEDFILSLEQLVLQGKIKKALKLAASQQWDDLDLVKQLRSLVLEADVVVAHNGDSFDTKKLNARILYHGLDPLPPADHFKFVDTLKVARKHFRLTSNRLDALANFLGLKGKMETPPGLWRDVLEGKPGTLDTMMDYNLQDVFLLEDVYLALRPYIHNHPNMNVLDTESNEPRCPKCNSTSLQRRGVRVTRLKQYRRWQCTSCGGWCSQATDPRSIPR